MIIGLTGGIASGKSFVAGILRELGAEIIDADEVYKQLSQPEASLYKRIVSEWGRDILGEKGEIDRKKLGAKIFSSASEREKLNALTHPHIIESIKEHIGSSSGTLIVIVAPLLIESGQLDLVDTLWLVLLDEEKQIERLMKRDKLSRDEACRRIHSQLSIEEKLEYADFIIDNNGSPESTRAQVVEKWKQMKG